MSQPRPMKFWEAVSAFREFKSEWEEVFGGEKWEATYGQSYLCFDELVHVQDRSTLDSYLPVELTREIAGRCARLALCLSEDGWLQKASACWAWQPGAIILTALDVHDRFGGSVIEEGLEYGSTKIVLYVA